MLHVFLLVTKKCGLRVHLVALFRDSHLVFLCRLLRKILNDFHKLHRKHPLLVTKPTNVPIIINLFNKHNLISCL